MEIICVSITLTYWYFTNILFVQHLQNQQACDQSCVTSTNGTLAWQFKNDPRMSALVMA